MTIIEHSLPPTQSAKAQDAAFEAAWQRILLMQENPSQFSTLFVFSGNEVLQLALVQRLVQTMAARGQTLLHLPAGDVAASLKQKLQSVTINPGDAEFGNAISHPIVLDCLETLFVGCDAATAREPGIVLLDLRLRWASLVGALLADFAGTKNSTDRSIEQEAVLQQSRSLLLSRLNERRAQLAELGPLVVVLPLDWTKQAAQLAPDLWTVRLSSLYLEEFAVSSFDALQLPLDGRISAEMRIPGVSSVHMDILQNWLNAHATRQIQHVVISDGWIAAETSAELGKPAQAQQIARQCLAMAYLRGSEREQLVSQGVLGNVLLDRSQAQEAYQVAMYLAEKLIEQFPDSARAKHDLSVTYEKLASILKTQGDHEHALSRFKMSLMIREKLVASDENNKDWQRDLSVIYDKVADILRMQGERVQALVEYKKSLAIREKLAASDPQNVQWQTDLVVSYARLADTVEMPSLKIDWLNRAMVILQKLDQNGLLTADQQGWIGHIGKALAVVRAKM
jgi:tetratricopeptide (TPR) repeat protein